MTTFPEFDKALVKIAFTRVAKESKKTCQTLRNRESKLTREAIEEYDVDEEYRNLVKHSPLLMSILLGASSSLKLGDILVGTSCSHLLRGKFIFI